MQNSLAKMRATFNHPGNKGISLENVFSEFLREYLPKRFEIGNGEVIDSFGNRTGQMDIVITNEDHPFTFSANGPGLFFVEGVSAFGEIKTNLTSQDLQKVLTSSMKCKNLKTIHGQGSVIFSNPSNERYFDHSPFFLFAYESQLTLDGIKETIERFCIENSCGITGVVDAVFIMGKGSLINMGDGKGSFGFRTSDGNPLQGWIAQEQSTVLFELLAFISLTMPKIIRFTPVLTYYLLAPEQRSEH